MFTNNRRFTFGADPEMFFHKGDKTEKYFWSAHGLVPGTKAKPFRVPKGAIQLDGVAAEFNIDPVTNENDFFENIKSVMSYLKYKIAKPNGFSLAAYPVAHFEENYYESLPSEVKELGCNPDWDAYTGKVNPRPKEPKELFRTGSGHIHIGWGNNFRTDDPNLLEACCHVVKHMDTCVGKPLSSSNYLSNNLFYLRLLDIKRRNLYGNFGAFRPTKYGVEYRTPSNIWLNHPKLIRWVYNNTCFAVEQAFKATRYDYAVSLPPSL